MKFRLIENNSASKHARAWAKSAVEFLNTPGQSVNRRVMAAAEIYGASIEPDMPLEFRVMKDGTLAALDIHEDMVSIYIEGE